MSRIEHFVSRRSVIAAGAVAAGGTLSPVVRGQSSNARGPQALLRTDLRVITLVNVFAVEPDSLPRLVEVLRDGTETFFSKMPGFVSSSVITARDGRRAINYSQWRSNDDVAAFRKDPRFEPYLARLQKLATTEGFAGDVVYVNSI